MGLDGQKWGLVRSGGLRWQAVGLVLGTIALYLSRNKDNKAEDLFLQLASRPFVHHPSYEGRILVVPDTDFRIQGQGTVLIVLLRFFIGLVISS